jgi:hypothetical protein
MFFFKKNISILISFLLSFSLKGNFSQTIFKQIRGIFEYREIPREKITKVLNFRHSYAPNLSTFAISHFTVFVF